MPILSRFALAGALLVSSTALASPTAAPTNPVATNPVPTNPVPSPAPPTQGPSPATPGPWAPAACGVEGAVATAQHQTCIAQPEGVVCLGQRYRRPGSGLDPSAGPRVVPGTGGSTAVALGRRFGCALVGTGGVACWGANDDGELGRGTKSAFEDAAAPVPGIADAIELGVGEATACALHRTGAVSCWGASAPTPAAVPGLSDAIHLSYSIDYGCAVRRSGAVACWGQNRFGQLGRPQGELGSSKTAVDVPGVADARVVATSGSTTTCAIVGQGAVRCWGEMSRLGLYRVRDGARRIQLEDVPGVTDAVGLAIGATSVCALHRAGTVSCWGNNAVGQLGDGTTVDRERPTPVRGVTGARHIATGVYGAHTCAVGCDRLVRCWGLNADAQLGDGTRTDRTLPVVVTTSVPPPLPGWSERELACSLGFAREVVRRGVVTPADLMYAWRIQRSSDDKYPPPPERLPVIRLLAGALEPLDLYDKELQGPARTLELRPGDLLDFAIVFDTSTASLLVPLAPPVRLVNRVPVIRIDGATRTEEGPYPFSLQLAPPGSETRSMRPGLFWLRPKGQILCDAKFRAALAAAAETPPPAAASTPPPVAAKVWLDRTTFAPGADVTVHFTAPGTFAEDAWIGIVPSSTPHGREAVVDAANVGYQYVSKRTAGTMTFKAPRPGAWDLRLCDTDTNGREVSSVSFTVTQPPDRTVTFAPGKVSIVVPGHWRQSKLEELRRGDGKQVTHLEVWEDGGQGLPTTWVVFLAVPEGDVGSALQAIESDLQLAGVADARIVTAPQPWQRQGLTGQEAMYEGTAMESGDDATVMALVVETHAKKVIVILAGLQASAPDVDASIDALLGILARARFAR